MGRKEHHAMLKLKHNYDCCGCGACAQVCPKNCIQMEEDDEGFLYPKIDSQKCVDCDLCSKACPIQNVPATEDSLPEAYAAYATDTALRRSSSSGGIFSLLANHILDLGGVVFGAALDTDLSVHHVMISSKEDLVHLRGSKYVQSRIENTYREVKIQLESGKVVLFSGVACQIAGLQTYLRKSWNTLYTVDVLCHGVPSPKVWRMYLQQQSQARNSHANDASFRDKTDGWKRFSMALQFRNGEAYRAPLTEDPFLRMFLTDICLRPSCYQCRFKNLPRSSDLTIGDAWGIDGIQPEMDDDQGTSLVFLNSEKGRQLWESVQPQVISQPGDANTLLPAYADSRRSVHMHINRKKFFRAVRSDASLEALLKLTHKTLPQRILSVAQRHFKALINRR